MHSSLFVFGTNKRLILRTCFKRSGYTDYCVKFWFFGLLLYVDVKEVQHYSKNNRET